jgi:hypothetical protein
VSYRDDHEAAVMRADAADRERARLADENLRLVRELDTARAWLGGPRYRAMVFVGMLVVGAGLVAAGHAMGQSTAQCPAHARPVAAITGNVETKGSIGEETLMPTQCHTLTDGLELVASDKSAIALTSRGIEVALAGKSNIVLDPQYCAVHRRYMTYVDDSYVGYVELDCAAVNGSVKGRIDFQHCQ